MTHHQRALTDAIESQANFARELFAKIQQQSQDVVGITRAGWSKEDQRAAEIIAAAATELQLETIYDDFGNLYCTLPGKDRTSPRVLSGSHLDSVPTGGNFDGLAGVLAGLTVQAACRHAGIEPESDLTTIGIRGEESVWYGIAYIGSRLSVGNLDQAELEKLIRTDTDRSLIDHMHALGFGPEKHDEPVVTAGNTRAFLELHIEQGPILVGESVPVAIPTTIRGNLRYPFASCRGEYLHSAATPRLYRRDAALAVADLVMSLDAFWRAEEARGVPDTVFTVGKMFTDPQHHAMTKVPGRCDFTLNFGGSTKTFLDDANAAIAREVKRIEQERNVVFDLGPCVGSQPTPLDPELGQRLINVAGKLDIPHMTFATVGHDASIYARAGIPSAMVLIRNEGGSHNPNEQMHIGDFITGTAVLGVAMLELAEQR
jgi:N-carbamoyl-L-amino-acid hydrolase